MVLKYIPFKLSNSPFPEQKHAYRPVISIEFDNGNGSFNYFVLVDSGADYCIFHAKIGELLGLNIKDGKPFTFFGTSGEPQQAFFHEISFKIQNQLHTCDVGFSYDLEKLPYGILGQCGFFDSWFVKFSYKDKEIELIKDFR